MSAPEITGFSASLKDRRCLEVWFERDVTDDDRAWLLRAINEAAEQEQLFDMQWKADQRAIKRWQEAHPDRPNIWPDRADMVVWLMEQHDGLRKVSDGEPV